MLMINLPVAVTIRTLLDFESLLRSKEWGEWLVLEPLVFLKGTMQIVDIACLICVGTAVPVEVLPASQRSIPGRARTSAKGVGKLQGPASAEAAKPQEVQGI